MSSWACVLVMTCQHVSFSSTNRGSGVFTNHKKPKQYGQQVYTEGRPHRRKFIPPRHHTKQTSTHPWRAKGTSPCSRPCCNCVKMHDFPRERSAQLIWVRAASGAHVPRRPDKSRPSLSGGAWLNKGHTKTCWAPPPTSNPPLSALKDMPMLAPTALCPSPGEAANLFNLCGALDLWADSGVTTKCLMLKPHHHHLCDPLISLAQRQEWHGLPLLPSSTASFLSEDMMDVTLFQKVTFRKMEETLPFPIISLEFVLQLEQTGDLFLLVLTQRCGIASPLGAVCQAEESLVGGSHQNLLLPQSEGHGASGGRAARPHAKNRQRNTNF